MTIRPLISLLFLISCTAGPEDTIDCTAQGCSPSFRTHLESPQTDLEVGAWHVELDIDGSIISAD